MTASDAISAKSCDATFEKLLNQGLSPEELFKHVCTQHVRLLLAQGPLSRALARPPRAHLSSAARHGRPELS